MYSYYCNCVNWPVHDVSSNGGLSDMIDNALDLTRTTLLKHVNRDQLKELEIGFGYSSHHTQGLTMAADWHISYHRSKLHGRTVYYFCYSGIEFVFTKD